MKYHFWLKTITKKTALVFVVLVALLGIAAAVFPTLSKTQTQKFQSSVDDQDWRRYKNYQKTSTRNP